MIILPFYWEKCPKCNKRIGIAIAEHTTLGEDTILNGIIRCPDCKKIIGMIKWVS